MAIVALLVLAEFKNNRIELASNPPYGAVLFWVIRSLIHIVRVGPNLLDRIESDSTLRVLLKLMALLFVELKAHRYMV